MLKFLLILILVFYLIFRVGGFLFRVFFLGALQSRQQNQSQQKQQSHRKAPNSNLNIDYIPGEKKEQSNDFRGGDYVDYEEVK